MTNSPAAPSGPDRPAEDGIARERQLTMPLRNGADNVLDTTDLSPAELRDELMRRYGGDTDQPVLTIASFAFARGISRTADLVFDLRFLANPHWVDELRPLTGADQPVRDYPAGSVLERDHGPYRIASHRLDFPLLGRGQKLRDRCIWMYRGRHRSVAAAAEMAERLGGAGFAPNVRHRDLASPPRGTIERHPGRASASEGEDELNR